MGKPGTSVCRTEDRRRHRVDMRPKTSYAHREKASGQCSNGTRAMVAQTPRAQCLNGEAAHAAV